MALQLYSSKLVDRDGAIQRDHKSVRIFSDTLLRWSDKSVIELILWCKIGNSLPTILGAVGAAAIVAVRKKLRRRYYRFVDDDVPVRMLPLEEIQMDGADWNEVHFKDAIIEIEEEEDLACQSGKCIFSFLSLSMEGRWNYGESQLDFGSLDNKVGTLQNWEQNKTGDIVAKPATKKSRDILKSEMASPGVQRPRSCPTSHLLQSVNRRRKSNQSY